MKVLEACEEELVCELSSVNTVEMCKAFFQACVITRDMCDNFTSLDHSRLEPQLQIRYLLRLVRMNIKTDVTAWGKFLILLDTLGVISNTLMKKLKKPMPQINEGSTEISETDVTAWGRFLVLLDTLGVTSNTLMEKLKKTMPQINEELTEISETNSSSTDTAGADASVEEELVLCHGDVGLVTELLVPISHKWEGMSVSLGFQENDR